MKNTALSAFIVLISILGTALILAREATYGVGLWADYATYITTARSLLDGDGFTQIYGWSYQHWPPLYPMLLAGATIGVFDPLDVAGPLNAALFGLTIFAAGKYLRSRVQHGVLVVWACLAIMLAIPLTRVAQMAMSEAPFILFTTLALIWACKALDSGKMWDLIWAAAFASLAFLTRYPGIVAIGTVLSLLLFQRGVVLSERVKRIALYTAITTLPMCLWFLRNYLSFGALDTPRNPAPYTIAEVLSKYVSDIAGWVFLDLRLDTTGTVSGVSDGYVPWALVGLVLAALVVAVGYTFIRAHWMRWSAEERHRWAPFYLFGGFALMYLMFFTLYQSHIDLQPLGDRYLSPMYIPLLFAAVFALDNLLIWEQKRNLIGSIGRLPAIRTIVRGGAERTHLLAVAVTIILPFWLGMGVAMNLRDTRLANEGVGLGLRGPAWADSELMEYVRGLPVDSYILSNSGRGIYIYTDHTNLLYLNPESLDVAIPKNHIGDAAEDAYLVWFFNRQGRYIVNYAYDWWELPGLEQIAELEDGIILKINLRGNKQGL